MGRASDGRSKKICRKRTRSLASRPGHPFHQRLNELLEAERSDEFAMDGERFAPRRTGVRRSREDLLSGAADRVSRLM